MSPDGARSHQKFIKKHALNFTLLSDLDNSLAVRLGIWVEKSMYGRKYMGIERTTYLINSDGKIIRVWRKPNPEGHAREVLGEIER